VTDLGYRLFDADNHYYEPRDCFTRYIEPSMRERAVRMATDHRGREGVLVGNRPFTFLADAFRDVAAKPGALRELLRTMSSGRIAESSVVEPVQPEYVDRDARLALMDRQGIESILLFPTLGVCVEHFMKDDPEQLYANFHAFNRWLDDDWGFDHEHRIFAAPMLSLRDLGRAVDELEFVLTHGARIIGLRPGPAYGRSRRSVLRSVLGPRRRGAHARRLPHRGIGLQRDDGSLLGRGAEPFVTPAIGVPMDELLR